MKKRSLAAALAAASLVLAGCAGEDLAEDDQSEGAAGGDGAAVVIGSQSFDEAALVTAMYDAILTDAGYEVEQRLVDARPAYLGEMPSGIDMAPEYVSGLADELNVEINGDGAPQISSNDEAATIEAMTPLLEEKELTLLEPSETTSQNAYFVTQQYSETEGVTKLSDLEGESITLAAAPDCEGRADCLSGLTEVYGIDVTLLPLGYASPDTYNSVIDGESQLGQTGTIDGTLEDQGLVLLEDDRGIQPAQNLVPVVSNAFLAEHPDVEDPLNALMAALDNDTLAALLVRVTVDREEVAAVADEFVTDEGLI